jgi:hypothetical protein
VRTARYFKPHARVRATIRTGSGKKTLRLRAGRFGRVTVPLTLGPGNPDQQYTPQAAADGTKVYTAHVRLKRSRR